MNAELQHFAQSIDSLSSTRPTSGRWAEQWSAWRLGDRESDPIALDDPIGLKDALNQALGKGPLQRGDTLAILHSHAGKGKGSLWLYAIKQSTKVGTWRAATDGGRKVFVGNLEPHLICETAVTDFAPILRFDAFRDDPVGRDPTLVEQRS